MDKILVNKDAGNPRAGVTIHRGVKHQYRIAFRVLAICVGSFVLFGVLLATYLAFIDWRWILLGPILGGLLIGAGCIHAGIIGHDPNWFYDIHRGTEYEIEKEQEKDG